MSSGLKILLVVLALAPILIMIVINFSNNKRVKENIQTRKGELESLKAGDKVMTISGIYGFVRSIDVEIVRLEVSKGVIIEVNKASIVCSV